LDAAARHARVKAEFLALRELDGHARAEGLARIEDAGVRGEVASLLGYDGLPLPLIRERPSDEMPLTHESDRPLLAGVVLCERFEVQAPVAEGGFGWVFRGRDRLRDEPVAVKLFKPIHDPELAAEVEAAFLREGRVLADLAHVSPHIVAYRDLGTWHDAEDQRHPFIVMEWLDGPTLHALCEERGEACSFGRAVEMLTPIAEALAIAHDRGVAHRDLKASNVLCVGDPERPTLKLVDFGAAKLAADRARGFDSTGGQVGMLTLHSSAPEQLSKSFGPSGPWSDVYALALLLVELALGRSPWAELDLFTVMDRVFDAGARPTPRRMGVEVTDAVEAVMARALAVDHQARPRAARAFWAELTAALEGPAPPAPRRRGLVSRLLRRSGH
jgi:serine/threonine protein kinase